MFSRSEKGTKRTIVVGEKSPTTDKVEVEDPDDRFFDC